MRNILELGLFSSMVLSPGTQRLSPRNIRVGIALRKDGEDLVVNALIPDGAAASSHAIQVGDRIIAVAQENGADVRVKGMSINSKSSPLFRGPKGTSVRLGRLFLSASTTRRLAAVSLVRGELKAWLQWGDGVLLCAGPRP